MSKKHFVAFASQIRALRRDAVSLTAEGNTEGAAALEKQASTCEEMVARVAADSNPRFDRETFFAACQ